VQQFVFRKGGKSKKHGGRSVDAAVVKARGNARRKRKGGRCPSPTITEKKRIANVELQAGNGGLAKRREKDADIRQK